MGKLVVKTKNSKEVKELTSQAKALSNVEASYKTSDVKQLKNWDTEFVVSVAKSIMDIADKIAKGIERDKQLMLGEVFNNASLAVKAGNKNVKVKDVREQLGIAETTWYHYINYYVTNRNFKEILSLGTLPGESFSLPKFAVTKELIGADSEEKLEFYHEVCNHYGKEPTRDEVMEYKKMLKGEAPKAKAEAEPALEKQVETTPTPEVDKTKECLDKLKEESGWYDLDDKHDNMEYDRDVPNDLEEAIAHIDHKQWKVMYKKGAKVFHPDAGGSVEEMNIWKQMAMLVERCFDNLEYVEVSKQLGEWEKDLKRACEEQ